MARQFCFEINWALVENWVFLNHFFSVKLQLSLLDFNHLTIFFQHYEYIGDFAKSEQKTCKLTVWNCNNQVQIYRGAAQYSKGLYFLWFFIKPQIQWGNFKMSGHVTILIPCKDFSFEQSSICPQLPFKNTTKTKRHYNHFWELW